MVGPCAWVASHSTALNLCDHPPTPPVCVTTHPHGIQSQPQVLLLHCILGVFHQLLFDPETGISQPCPLRPGGLSNKPRPPAPTCLEARPQ